MAYVEPFHTLNEQYRLTEHEMTELKKRLLVQRREYVLLLNRLEAESALRRVEQNIARIEHRLAHAEIVYEEEAIEKTNLELAADSVVEDVKHKLASLHKKLKQHWDIPRTA